MFRPFRRRRHTDSAHTPEFDEGQADFGSAWADYVEWSGLDEAGLPEGARPAGRTED